MSAPSPFPEQAEPRPLSVRVADAKRLRDFAAQNLADALRNVELAELTAKAAEAQFRAVEAEAGR